MACYRPGDRPHLYYTLHVYCRRKGEAKRFTWADYRDLILATHRGLSARLVWVWDNLTIHLASELADFAEGIWSLLKRSMAQLRRRRPARPGPHRQAQAQENPVPAHLIDGCLADTGLIIEPW